jgi:transposase
MERMVERCAGLDVHRDTVTACVRVPGERERRRQEIQTFATTTRGLLALRDWLAAFAVTLVGMEATGVYWKPIFYTLEDDFECWLINATHIKQVPGRKTDVADAAWICQLVEHGLVRPSFVPPPEIRELRDLTRYRKALIQERSREVQRLEKMLQDAGIKLSSVASQIMGVSGRSMIEALVSGSTDPIALAELAKGRLRAKLPHLQDALQGRFRAHHGVLVGHCLAHIDHLEEIIDALSSEIDTVMAPFARAVELLDTIPGIDKRMAEVLIAELGADMSRFPSEHHLASWAGVCPGNNESAGKRRSGRTRRGPKWLRAALFEAAWAAIRTKDTYLKAQYLRIARRQGKKKAIGAVAHSILVAVYFVLLRETEYVDLGSDYFTRHQNTDAHIRRLVRQLENLGQRVTIEPLRESA